jgi:hypothetical protein
MTKETEAKLLTGLLKTSAIDYSGETLSTDELFELARQKEQLKQLHGIFLDNKIEPSKLRAGYQWKNMQSSLNADCEKHASLLKILTDKFINYSLNFGEKALIIEQLTLEPSESAEIKAKLEALTVEDWSAEKELLFKKESQTDDLVGLGIQNYRRDTGGNHVFLLYENFGTTSLETPDEGLLTQSGMQLRGQLFLQKRTITGAFHRIIISKDLKYRIILIDPSVLNRTETASDKTAACLARIYEDAEISVLFHKGAKPVYNFSAIQEVYKDDTAGRMTGGYFITSSGSQFINTSSDRDIDLRKDTFQKAGDAGHKGELEFVKIKVDWPLPGCPRVNLNGSAEMFSNRAASLPDLLCVFSTEDKKEADFLVDVLKYSTWI